MTGRRKTKSRKPGGEMREAKAEIARLRDEIAHSSRLGASLRESEEKFKTLAEESPNMIFINQNGRVVYANRRSEELMGYTRDEFYAPGFDFLTLVAPEYRKQTVRFIQQHMKGREVPSYEYVVVTKAGKRIDADISTKLIPYGGGRAILGIVTDISALKRTEAKLRLSMKELRAQKRELEDKNIALREVLAQIQGEKSEIGRRVAANVEKLLTPLLVKIRQIESSDTRLASYVDLLEEGLKDLTSSFGLSIGQGPAVLSPRETEICTMIRRGMGSKEIAGMLRVSVGTVITLRHRIRKKLRLCNKGANLATHLQAMAHSSSGESGAS